jgi:FtsZ-binding cell division protein ZapB
MSKLRIKPVQLWLHKHYHTIRQWLIFIVGITLLLFSMVSVANQNRLINQVKNLAEQNTALSKQNKDLNEQTNQLGKENQAIATQNREYTRCLSIIFAQYTHDFVPINIENLDTCTIKADGGQLKVMPTTGNSSSETKISTPIYPKLHPSNNNQQPENTQNQGNSPGLGERIIQRIQKFPIIRNLF